MAMGPPDLQRESMMTDHPGKIAASLCHSPKLAARASGLTQAECRAIRSMQTARSLGRSFTDPLIVAARTRHHRTASTVLAQTIDQALRDNEAYDREQRELRREAEEKAVRTTLLAAAREARKLGFAVRPSKDRAGRVSSYYLTRVDLTGALRISDHAIPASSRREFMAAAHGRVGYDGYHGAEIIITEARSTTWLRRAIILAAAGRSIP